MPHRLGLAVLGCVILSTAFACAASGTASSSGASRTGTTSTGDQQERKITYAKKLADYREYALRFADGSIVDVEAALGPPRRLAGRAPCVWLNGDTATADYSWDDVPGELGKTLARRRYAVSPARDAVVTYMTCREALSLEERVTERAVQTTTGGPGVVNYIYENDSKIRKNILAAQDRSLRAGAPDLIVAGNPITYFIDMTPAQQRDAWMEEGDNWMKEGRGEEAARCFDSAAAIQPPSAQAFWKSAVAYIAAGNRNAAAASLNSFKKTATPEQVSETGAALSEVERRIEAIPVK